MARLGNRKIKRDANLSFIIPGPCNAKCGFCFWKPGAIPPDDYLEKAARVLNGLPEDFWQISITGSEPSLSPYCDSVLALINKTRWTKVVMTTNATRGLVTKLEYINKADHINISRHSIDEERNRDIFKSKSVPTLVELEDTIGQLNRFGIDVTLNCVLVEVKTRQDVLDFLRMARDIGASSVSFRKVFTDTSSLDPTMTEMLFDDYAVISENYCPVCRSKKQIIGGMPITWKTSVIETDKDPEEIYELVFHESGVLTSTWSGVGYNFYYTINDNGLTNTINTAYRQYPIGSAPSGGGSSCGGGGSHC